MKKCPYCEELIQDSAKKCRYCGEWFETSETKVSELVKNDYAQQKPVTNSQPMSALEIAHNTTLSSSTHERVDTIGSFMNINLALSWLLAFVLIFIILLSLPNIEFFPFSFVCLGDFIVVALVIFFLYKVYDWLKKQKVDRSIVKNLSRFMITYAISHVVLWPGDDLFWYAVSVLTTVMAIVFIIIVIFKVKKLYSGTLLIVLLYALSIVAADIVYQLMDWIFYQSYGEEPYVLIWNILAYGVPSLMTIYCGAKLFGNQYVSTNILEQFGFKN